MDVDALNATFAIAGRLRFEAGPGGLPLIAVGNAHASARISVYAGQVLAYRPHDQAHDLLFVSSQASYQPGKAIRGGVPICWPWFGPDPEERGRPAHGLARTRPWRVTGTQSDADGATRIRLELRSDADTLALWPHAFVLSLDIVVGASLELVLETRNLGVQPFTVSQALHSYFAVGDIGQAGVLGLDGCDYLDKVTGAAALQHGELRVAGEVDRIYRDPPDELVIVDDAWARRIHISASGSRSAVVWNPWSQLAARMNDLGDADYRRMLCVETANAGPDTVTLPAGAQHRLGARYRIATNT